MKNTSVHSASGRSNRSGSVHSTTSESLQSQQQNPLAFVSKGVSNVVGGVSGVVGGVSGVVGGVVGGVATGVNNIIQGATGARSNSLSPRDAHTDEYTGDAETVTPAAKFLTDLKPRTYNESATQRIHKNNFSNLTYQEIRILKQLEEHRLENVSLRGKCIDFEMQTRKCEFFANEVGTSICITIRLSYIIDWLIDSIRINGKYYYCN